VLVADRVLREEADQETPDGTAGALGDAADARVPGQHAHRLVQLQPAELLVVRRADGRAQLSVGRRDGHARERGHVRTERPVRVRAEAAGDARPDARHVPAVQSDGERFRRADADPVHREPRVRPVHVAARRTAVERVRGGRGHRHTAGRRQAQVQDHLLQFHEPGVQRDVRVSRAVRRARVRPVPHRGRQHQPSDGAARHAAQERALRLPAREHAVHAEQAAAAHRAVRVHRDLGGRARARRRGVHHADPGPQSVRVAGRGQRAVGQAQEVPGDRVRHILGDVVLHVQSDAGQYGRGRDQVGVVQAWREGRRAGDVRAPGGSEHVVGRFASSGHRRVQ